MNLRKKLKDLAKSILRLAGIDITRNMRYDRLTARIIRSQLNDGDHAIDIGAHSGEILDLFLLCSPAGKHMAIEPIPALAQGLRQKYLNRCAVIEWALSNHSGTASFQMLKADPAYSGLRRRDTGSMPPDFQELQVKVCRLDDVVDPSFPIRLVKIDVEGGEYDVLRGAPELLKRDKPLLIFEFGKGAADRYGVRPNEMYRYLSATGYSIHTLADADLGFHTPLSSAQFEQCFEQGSEYYFVARGLTVHS